MGSKAILRSSSCMGLIKSNLDLDQTSVHISTILRGVQPLNSVKHVNVLERVNFICQV